MIPLRKFRSQSAIFFLLFFIVSSAQAVGVVHAAQHVVIIDKARRELAVCTDGRETARFPATFGVDPLSDKSRAHDLATPEGLYFIAYRKVRTRFHRTLGLSFPNLADAQQGLAAGVVSGTGYARILDAVRKSRPAPCDTGLGCGIAIHGGGVFRQFGEFRERDWTEGCVALDNRDIEALFNLCGPGDPVLIFNSGRNLRGILRPFAEVRDLDGQGRPVCPDGVCAYEVRLMTSLGMTKAVIREGKAYGMSLEAEVCGPGSGREPRLVLTDRNADGEMSFLDSATGSIAGNSSPQAVYDMLREAVVEALSAGVMPVGGNAR